LAEANRETSASDDVKVTKALTRSEILMPKHDYEIGYGRPPQHTRFTKGQSGNSRGRCKGSQNLATILARELDKPATVISDGKQKTMKVRDALVIHAVNQAVAGSMRHFELLLKLDNLEPQPKTTFVWFVKGDERL
jgi:Family of unknown function (DUF5681)